MYCTSCGGYVSETDKFCSNCGAQIIKPLINTTPELTAILTDENANPADFDETVNEPITEEAPLFVEEAPVSGEEAPVLVEEAPKGPEKKKVSKSAIAGLILGILALALAATCCGCFFSFAPAVAGIVLSSIGIAKSKDRTLAIIALVLSISAIVLSIVDIAMFNTADFEPIINSFDEIEGSFDFYDYF